MPPPAPAAWPTTACTARASSWSSCNTGWAPSVSWGSTPCAPKIRTPRQPTTACSTRSPPCAGCRPTLPRLAAIPPTSPSAAIRPAPPTPCSSRTHRWPGACSAAPSCRRPRRGRRARPPTARRWATNCSTACACRAVRQAWPRCAPCPPPRLPRQRKICRSRPASIRVLRGNSKISTATCCREATPATPAAISTS